MLLKRIRFALQAAVDVFRATKGYACDKPLAVMTAEDVQQLITDLNQTMAERHLLYQVVDHVVDGGSPCDFCRDRDECEHKLKGYASPMCQIWDLLELVPADGEEGAHEPAAEAAGTEGNP